MRYYFYPFNDTTQTALLHTLAGSLGGVAPQYAAPLATGLVYATDDTYRTTLSTVLAVDEVYILGHTASEQKVLGGADGTIDQTEIVKRLNTIGLPKTVACRIVLHACFSANGGRASLAAMVASALKNSEFACRDNVWGYTRKVSTRAHTDASGQPALCIDAGSDPKRPRWESIEYHPHAFIRQPPNH